MVNHNMSGPYVHARFLTPHEHGMAVTDIVCHDKGLSQNAPRSHVLPCSTLHGSLSPWAIRSYVTCRPHSVSQGYHASDFQSPGNDSPRAMLD